MLSTNEVPSSRNSKKSTDTDDLLNFVQHLLNEKDLNEDALNSITECLLNGFRVSPLSLEEYVNIILDAIKDITLTTENVNPFLSKVKILENKLMVEKNSITEDELVATFEKLLNTNNTQAFLEKFKEESIKPLQDAILILISKNKNHLKNSKTKDLFLGLAALSQASLETDIDIIYFVYRYKELAAHEKLSKSADELFNTYHANELVFNLNRMSESENSLKRTLLQHFMARLNGRILANKEMEQRALESYISYSGSVPNDNYYKEVIADLINSLLPHYPNIRELNRLPKAESIFQVDLPAQSALERLKKHAIKISIQRIEQNVKSHLYGLCKENRDGRQVLAALVVQELVALLLDNLVHTENELFIKWYVHLHIQQTVARDLLFTKCAKHGAKSLDTIFLATAELKIFLTSYHASLDLSKSLKVIEVLEQTEHGLNEKWEQQLQNVWDQFRKKEATSDAKSIFEHVYNKRDLYDAVTFFQSYFQRFVVSAKKAIWLIDEINKNPAYISNEEEEFLVDLIKHTKLFLDKNKAALKHKIDSEQKFYSDSSAKITIHALPPKVMDLVPKDLNTFTLKDPSENKTAFIAGGFVIGATTTAGLMILGPLSPTMLGHTVLQIIGVNSSTASFVVGFGLDIVGSVSMGTICAGISMGAKKLWNRFRGPATDIESQPLVSSNPSEKVQDKEETELTSMVNPSALKLYKIFNDLPVDSKKPVETIEMLSLSDSGEKNLSENVIEMKPLSNNSDDSQFSSMHNLFRPTKEDNVPQDNIEGLKQTP